MKTQTANPLQNHHYSEKDINLITSNRQHRQKNQIRHRRMTIKPSYSAKQQAKNIIVETARAQNPQTTTQLIKLVQQKTGYSEEHIKSLLLELEDEDKLRFTKNSTPLPINLRAFVFSRSASWYWITVAISMATAVSVFAISENSPIVYLRSALGIVFVLFLPGYAFIKMLFPSALPIATTSQELDGIERVSLSIGMSLALTPIIGLILNYTPWGIRLAPITLSLLALTTVFATVAVIREQQTKTNRAQTSNST
jgi:hypothetical protein